MRQTDRVIFVKFSHERRRRALRHRPKYSGTTSLRRRSKTQKCISLPTKTPYTRYPLSIRTLPPNGNPRVSKHRLRTVVDPLINSGFVLVYFANLKRVCERKSGLRARLDPFRELRLGHTCLVIGWLHFFIPWNCAAFSGQILLYFSFLSPIAVY